MQGKALSTDGVKLQYCCETTAGTRPTTGFQDVSEDLKSTPDLNPTPETRETTTFADAATGWKAYIDGLRDPGGALPFNFNNTEAFHTAWNAMKAAVDAAASGETPKATWFCIIIPGLSKAFYFAGTPADLGLAAMEVNGIAEINGYITPNKIAGWAAKPTT